MMATPVQTLNACTPEQQQQQPQKNSSESPESANVALKNGTRMEEGKAEAVPANMMVNSKAKASNAGRAEPMTMENFQDVGAPHPLANLNTEPPFAAHSEVNNYAPNSGEQGTTNEDYSKMNDSGHGPLAGYVAGYNNRPGYLADQHGGAQGDQYNQQYNVRAPYAPPSKMMAMGPPRAPNANMMPGYSTPPGHQRFMSGHSISQQAGPTPTLNQLLQSPNPVHRSQNSYSDYNPMGQGFGKGPAELGSGYPGSPQNWASARGINAYPQQVGSPAYRNQGGSMDHGQPSSLKRPGGQAPYMPGAATTYPPQQPSQSQGQYGPQFTPRYGTPHGPQIRPSQIGISSSGYPQHQMPQYNTQQGPPQQMAAAFDQRPSQGYMPPQGSQNYTTNRPQQPTAPTPPAKENTDLPQDASGTSGEEGSSEGNPGTPTPPVATHPSVAALRPSSSPSGSRSMSPAISNQQSNIPMPPRPSSQSDSGQPARMSQSPIAAQTGYSQSMAPPHMAPPMYGNKMHPGMMGGSQQMGPYSSQSQQYPQGNFPRSQSSIGMPGYGSQPQTYPGSPANSMGQPYGMNRMGNHMPPQGYGGQYSHSMNSQFGSHGYGMSPSSGGGVTPNSLPGQSSSQGPPPQMMTPNLMAGKGVTGAQVAAQAVMVAAASSTSSRSPLHPKHQLQPKTYVMSSNCGPSGNSPGSGPMPSSRDSPGMPLPMPPPAVPTTPPTPSSTPTPNPPAVSSPDSTLTSPSALSMIQCEGNSEQRATSAGGMGVNAIVAGPGSSGSGSLPTSAIEPAVQDEASQHSTASNTSNTEERAETPRPRKDIPHSHPPTPASALPSPGAASMSSLHDEFESVSSPSWPRTPASPVVNSQVHEYHPPPTTSSKRADNLSKLYDISDDPDRRAFLDRLVRFNEERGTAITQCPTISKQPLDLYKLYLVVKDRAGFVEVTKAKHWKDVAGQIGIGASSSAAYTLRKQYVKHLLPFECKFDRGGIDPQPIISSLEAATRKKPSSKANTAPSPAGSSNSQDSFPASNSQSMDGFPTPPGPYNQYNQAGNTNSDYGGQMLGPPHVSMSSGDSSHQNMLPNHNNESINVQNPFADEMPGHQYNRPGSGMPPPGIQNSSYETYSRGGSIPPRPQGMSSSMPPPYSGAQGIPGPTSAPGSFSYNEQMRPLGPQGQEQYPNEQYRRGQGVNHEGYGSRPADSYPASTSGFPPTRMPSTPPQYPYGTPQYDRERYEQRPGGMMPSGQPMRPPSQSAMMPQHSSESSSYPPPHRYSAQPMGSGETPVYPARPYSGPPPPSTQQPGFTPTTASSAAPATVATDFRQDQSYTMTSPTPSADSPQAHLTPDSPKKSQCYTAGPSQPAAYSPSSKMMPPQGYPQGPKRHPDFMKPSEQQFGSGPTYNQGQTTQPPYSGWRSETQFSGYGQGPTGQSSPREDWPSREQGGQWPRSYPPPQGHYNQGSNMHMTATMSPQNPMGPNPPLRFMVQRIPAGYKDKQQQPYTMQQPKVQTGPQMTQNAQYPPKREITFPADSVEAVPPVLVKRKRMLARDVTPVEAWRLMMALKSGLLCESTWALDVLSVLLFDDNTVLYFSLQHLPGLLEVLMEHYRRCLAQAFGISEELEIGFTKQQEPDTPVDPWYCNEDDGSSSEGEDVDLGVVRDVNVKDRISILDSENYTLKSHHGKVVKVLSKSDLFISDADKAWDTFEGFTGTSEHWQLGGGDTTFHIQTHFENGKNSVKFVRLMKDITNITNDEATECTTNECIDRLTSGDNINNIDRTISDSSKMLLDCPIKKELLDKSDHSSVPNVSTDEVKIGSPVDMCTDDETNLAASPKPSCQQPSATVQPRPKRRRMEDYEDEAYNRDEPSLFLITDSQDSLLRRCICLSNILRSLSFVPGNDSEMSKHPGFLLVMGKLLLLRHIHALRRQNQRNYDKEEDSDFSDSCSSLHDHEWWWDGLHVLRENTLVTLANISGQLDLSQYPEEISLPILDGLLHWSVCPAAYAQDPLPTLPAHSVLSPQRLSLEALCKLSVQENNVDLILATPPFSRIERLFGFLARSLGKQEDPVVREFAVVLLHYFAQAESGAARVIACQSTSVSLLVAFVEQAEQSALSIANSHGINMLRENPEMMGTSLDMLRRAANTLLALSRVPENRSLFLQHQQRLLSLVMSQILDQHVAAILADVLYECSQSSDGLL